MRILFLKYLLVTAGWESIVPLRKNLRPKKSFNPCSHENHIFLNLSDVKYRRDRRCCFGLENKKYRQITNKRRRLKTNESVSIEYMQVGPLNGAAGKGVYTRLKR